MAHPLPLNDFRALRFVLDPDDFARSDGKPDPEPFDLIAQEVWETLTMLSSDVSIRTSNNHGKLLASEQGLWATLVEAVIDDPRDAVLSAILDVADEFHATTFDLLHGFYRQAASSLRSALELILDGAEKALTSKSGSHQPSTFKFQRTARTIRGAERAKRIDDALEARCDRTLFGRPPDKGWIGDLYGRLCDYAHARRGHTLGDMWQSNGPIYVGEAVQNIHLLFVETYCAVCVLACLGQASLRLPRRARGVLTSTEVTLPKVALAALDELYPGVFA
jgi:hypothetical protein